MNQNNMKTIRYIIYLSMENEYITEKIEIEETGSTQVTKHIQFLSGHFVPTVEFSRSPAPCFASAPDRSKFGETIHRRIQENFFIHATGFGISDDESSESVGSVGSADSSSEKWIDQFSDDERIEMEITISEMAEDFIRSNIEIMANPNFIEKMVHHIVYILFEEWFDAEICDQDDDYDEIVLLVSPICHDIFDKLDDIPERSERSGPSSNATITQICQFDQIGKTIQTLTNADQPKQKSKEWYEYRYNLITASNIWKLFSSEAQFNSLVYEKCKPLDTSSTENRGFQNTTSPLHWGVKYEPVTIMLYEHKYKTKVAEFGCIKHDTVKCIGASPDGINVDPNNVRYGRMLEVKNIVNRVIDGIPSEAYWIQMQVQMETCKLDECDFAETRFKEYNSESEFYFDENREFRGVILYFIKKTLDSGSGPYYQYMPLSISLEKDAINEWARAKRAELADEYSLYETIYWYLDEFSCVLVKRNKLWFQSVIPKIKESWQIIEQERISGYEHRSPKKKRASTEVIHYDNPENSHIIKNMPTSNNVCLIRLDHDGNTL
jgi:putative phage-type endonuclease